MLFRCAAKRDYDTWCVMLGQPCRVRPGRQAAGWAWTLLSATAVGAGELSVPGPPESACSAVEALRRVQHRTVFSQGYRSQAAVTCQNEISTSSFM